MYSALRLLSADVVILCNTEKKLYKIALQFTSFRVNMFFFVMSRPTDASKNGSRQNISQHLRGYSIIYFREAWEDAEVF